MSHPKPYQDLADGGRNTKYLRIGKLFYAETYQLLSYVEVIVSQILDTISLGFPCPVGAIETISAYFENFTVPLGSSCRKLGVTVNAAVGTASGT